MSYLFSKIRIGENDIYCKDSEARNSVNAISESFYTVPVEMKADISFGFYESLMGVNLASEEIKTVNFDVTDLYGKRVSIYYTPATQEDEEIVKAYGGIYNTPSYLVRVAPRLAIDGETVLTGPEVMPGTHTGFSMVINQPGSSETKVDNPLVAGGNYAVSFDYGMISVPQLERDVERMKELSDTYKIENMFEDSVMGEVLSEIGTLYFAKNDVYNRYISMATGVRAERQICEAMLGSKPRVTYLFGVPVRLGVGTFYIDVDTDVSGVASVKANNNDEVSYMALSGMIGSAMEGAIFEEITGIPSVSTMTVLRKANNRGIGIVCIDKSNAELIDSIETDEASRSEMKRAVKKGNIVIAPEKEICYYEWEGSGYISLDCKTGAGAYMISGSICGGSEALKSDLFLYSKITSLTDTGE